MTQPNILKSKNYEIPQCTICMEDMIDNLSVTSCGHVFHTMWYPNCLYFLFNSIVFLKGLNTEVSARIVVKEPLKDS